jgi:hypothetical protein
VSTLCEQKKGAAPEKAAAPSEFTREAFIADHAGSYEHAHREACSTLCQAEGGNMCDQTDTNYATSLEARICELERKLCDAYSQVALLKEALAMATGRTHDGVAE